jgi:hypothetical protein
MYLGSQSYPGDHRSAKVGEFTEKESVTQATMQQVKHTFSGSESGSENPGSQALSRLGGQRITSHGNTPFFGELSKAIV